MKVPTVVIVSLVLPLLGGAADFKTEILPIFQAKCFRCHGDGESRGGLSLDAEKIEKHIGRSEAINPGKTDDSELIERITVAEGNNRMPRNGAAMPENEVALIKAWIEAGAKLDEASAETPAAGGGMTQPARVKEDWTNREGRTITATLLKVDGANALLLLENGKSVPYPIANLSDESQAKVKAFAEKP